MKISVVILLGTVLGALSLVYGHQRTDIYTPYYGFNHPKDPFQSKGQSPQMEWRKYAPTKWPTYKKEMGWKGPRKYPSFGHSPSKWYRNIPNSPTEVPKWKKNPLRVRQYIQTTEGNRVQPEGAILFVPLRPRPNLNLDQIRWPDYIPPVAMIKLRLDDPPIALD